MVELSFLFRGFIIGFSIAATVGPISILCIQRTLQRGFLVGLVSGLGVATADAFYGSIAGLGLTVLARFLVSEQGWIRLIGGLFLVYLGLRTVFTQPAVRAAVSINAAGLLRAYVSTCLLTLTNPLTILSFIAIFAGLGVGMGRNSMLAALLSIGGVFLGSASWWCLLVGLVNYLRRKITLRWLLWINRSAGLVIFVAGLFILLEAVNL